MQIELTQMSTTLLSIGGIFLVGFAADLAGRYTPLPRVTLLLLCGLLFGPAWHGGWHCWQRNGFLN